MSHPPEKEPRYQILAVSKLTGISIDTLRAWERRYGAVTPQRDGRGRTYSEVDVARLRLLQQAVNAGHSIGRVARLGDEELRRLLDEPPKVAPAAPTPAAMTIDRSRLSAALLSLDTAAIDQECSRLALVMPPFELVRDVLLPTLREVGDVWHARSGGIAHEHVISGTIRHLLGSFLRMYSRRESRLRMLFATPAGDRHEIGILAAAMLAANQGLSVSYVGPDLPAREILEAVSASNAQVLVLGVTFLENTPSIADEVAAIAAGLPPEVELWVGGPAAGGCAPSLGLRGRILGDLDDYHQQLTRLAAQNHV